MLFLYKTLSVRILSHQLLYRSILTVAVLFYAGTLLSSPLQPTVTVTATRHEQPIKTVLADTTVITHEDIVRSQAPDILELLRIQSGIDWSRTGGPGSAASLFMRGSNSNHVLVLINGVRVSSTNTGAFAWEHLPLEQIERIEIVRGPRASYYGADAIGGIIQIFTRRVAGQEATVRVGRYDRLSGTAGIGQSTKNSDWSVFVGGEQFGGFSALLPGYYGYDPDNDGYIRRHISLQGQHALGSQVIQLQAMHINSDVEFDQGKTAVQEQSWGVTVSGDLQSQWQHQLIVGGMNEKLDTPAFYAAYLTKRQSLDWIHRFNLSDSQQIIAGLNYLHERGENWDTFTHQAQYQADRDNRAVFASWQYALKPFSLEVSARHDDNSVYPSATTWQTAAGWQFSNGWRTWVSLGEGYRAPSLNELYYPGYGGYFAGNPKLASERSFSKEWGVDWQISTTQKLGSRIYQTQMRDLIAYQGNDLYQAVNVDRVKIDGAELHYSFTQHNWSLDANVTWQDPRDQMTDEVLLRRPHRKLGMAIDHNLNYGVRLGLETQWASQRADYNQDLGGYAVWALRSDWQFSPQWNIGLRLDNLFNHAYALVDGYATPGRTLLVTLHFREQ